MKVEVKPQKITLMLELDEVEAQIIWSKLTAECRTCPVTSVRGHELCNNRCNTLGFELRNAVKKIREK